MLEVIEANPNAVTALATVALTFVTVVLVFITGYYGYENRQMRIEAQKPQIVIAPYPDHLCVENKGAGIAYDVQFKFKCDALINCAPVFFIKGLNHLEQGGSKGIRVSPRDDEEEEKQIKTPFKINVTYKDSRKKKYDESFCIDFNETEDVSDMRRLVVHLGGSREA